MECCWLIFICPRMLVVDQVQRSRNSSRWQCIVYLLPDYSKIVGLFSALNRDSECEIDNNNINKIEKLFYFNVQPESRDSVNYGINLSNNCSAWLEKESSVCHQYLLGLTSIHQSNSVATKLRRSSFFEDFWPKIHLRLRLRPISKSWRIFKASKILGQRLQRFFGKIQQYFGQNCLKKFRNMYFT